MAGESVKTLQYLNDEFLTEKIGDYFLIYTQRALDEFKKELKKELEKEIKKEKNNEKLLGVKFKNEYSGQKETFPSDVEELKIRDLYAILRCGGLGTKVSPEDLGKLQIIFKSTAVAGTFKLRNSGQDLLVIDTSGFNWQKGLYDMGSIFFYPDDIESRKATQDPYVQWQEEAYKALLGEDRPDMSDDPSMLIEGEIGGIKGVFDLSLVRKGIKHEFLTNLRFANEVAKAEGKTLDFRYLSAGMGIFSKGITSDDPSNEELLFKARLYGILGGLNALVKADPEVRQLYLSNISVIQLPHSVNNNRHDDKQEIVKDIIASVEELGIKFGTAEVFDGINEPANEAGILASCTSCGNPTFIPGQGSGVYGAIASDCELFRASNILKFEREKQGEEQSKRVAQENISEHTGAYSGSWTLSTEKKVGLVLCCTISTIFIGFGIACHFAQRGSEITNDKMRFFPLLLLVIAGVAFAVAFKIAQSEKDQFVPSKIDEAFIVGLDDAGKYRK